MFSMYICSLQDVTVAYVFVYLCSNNEVRSYNIICIYISIIILCVVYYIIIIIMHIQALMFI